MEHLNELISPTKFSEKLSVKLGKIWSDSELKPLPSNGASINEKWETVFSNIRQVIIKVASEPDFPIDFNFGDTQFSEYAKCMENIDPEGKLKKVIVRPGIGDVIPPKSTVYIFYRAFLEHEEYPFTSSDVHSKSPRKYEIGSGSLCEGYNTAISTMKLGEKAHFLLSPDIAYGERGIPPLIPPDSEILFEVELCDIDKPDYNFSEIDFKNAITSCSEEEIINNKEDNSVLILDNKNPVLCNNMNDECLENNKISNNNGKNSSFADDDTPMLIDYESHVLIVEDGNSMNGKENINENCKVEEDPLYIDNSQVENNLEKDSLNKENGEKVNSNLLFNRKDEKDPLFIQNGGNNEICSISEKFNKQEDPLHIENGIETPLENENSVQLVNGNNENQPSIVNENCKQEIAKPNEGNSSSITPLPKTENSPRIKVRDIRTLLINAEPDPPVNDNKIDNFKKINRNNIVMKAVKEIHDLANTFYKMGNFTCANINYRKAENLLTTLECSNEKDEKVRKEILLKMIVNQIITLVSGNKIKSKPREAVKVALRAFQNIPAEAAQSSKFKYNLAKAYILLNEDRKALQLLKEARKLEPNNEIIRNLFYKVDKEVTDKEENETKCWNRAREKFPEHDTKGQYIEFLRGSIKNDLENYLENPLANIGMPWNYTTDERLTLKSESERMNLTYEENRTHPANVLITIHKKGSALLITEKDEILHEAKELLTTDDEDEEDFIGWDIDKNEDISIVEEGTTLPKIMKKSFSPMKSPTTIITPKTPPKNNSPSIVVNKTKILTKPSLKVELTSPFKIKQRLSQSRTIKKPPTTIYEANPSYYSIKKSPITFRNIAPKPFNVTTSHITPVNKIPIPAQPSGIIPRAIRSSSNFPRIRGIYTPRTRGGNYFSGRSRGHNFLGPGRGIYYAITGPINKNQSTEIFNNFYKTSIKRIPPKNLSTNNQTQKTKYTEENNVCVIIDSSDEEVDDDDEDDDDDDDDEDDDDDDDDEEEENIPEFTDQPGCSGLKK